MATSDKRIYYVMTPQYEEVVPVLDYGEGPSEPVRDIVTVLASSKHEAKKVAYPFLRRQKWFERHYEHDRHPYAYLTVETGDGDVYR